MENLSTSNDKKFCIALDYDDTFTSNKPMWSYIVHLFKSNNIDVRFVTARFRTAKNYSNDDIIFDGNNLNIPVIFCNGIQKAQRCEDLGFSVDIWIDDFPVLIPKLEHLENIIKGVKVNDDKQRTVLDKTEKEVVYSSEPLVIGECR